MTDAATLRQALNASRTALLEALQDVSEREFAAEVEPGLALIGALATLAPAERQAVRDARSASGAPERPRPPAAGNPGARVTPPQVVHDLAGARYETLLFLDTVEGGSPSADAFERIAALLGPIEERELTAARLVRLRPRGETGLHA